MQRKEKKIWKDKINKERERMGMLWGLGWDLYFAAFTIIGSLGWKTMCFVKL